MNDMCQYLNSVYGPGHRVIAVAGEVEQQAFDDAYRGTGDRAALYRVLLHRRSNSASRCRSRWRGDGGLSRRARRPRP
jgi:hypothetical protein